MYYTAETYILITLYDGVYFHYKGEIDMNYKSNMNNNEVRLILGNGKIIITPVTPNTIMFKQLKHYAKVYQVGESIVNVNTIQGIDNQFALVFDNISEIEELKRLLSGAYENNVFKFKHLVFDFSNYNRKSVDCIIDQLNWIERFMPQIKAI